MTCAVLIMNSCELPQTGRPAFVWYHILATELRSTLHSRSRIRRDSASTNSPRLLIPKIVMHEQTLRDADIDSKNGYVLLPLSKLETCKRERYE